MVGEPAGIRTPDLLIKSQLLYRLSYGLESASREWIRARLTASIEVPARAGVCKGVAGRGQ